MKNNSDIIKKKGVFTGVRIHKYLLDEITKRINNDPLFRYPTKARFVEQAVVEKLEKEDRKIKDQD